MSRPTIKSIAGFSMIEVLITIVILMFGLLALAGLQGRAVTAQMESYQRSQALILLKDMADRISANRKNAASYVTAEVGTGAACPAAGATTASKDLNEWCNSLLGAAEVQGASNIGAMIGARGCITQVVAPATGVASQYLVAVAWQGLNSTATSTITCGQNQYGSESLRRVVAVPVNIADLL
jgi:type IV pilus assembly protein PilV